jgi:hypothetical protein
MNTYGLLLITARRPHASSIAQCKVLGIYTEASTVRGQRPDPLASYAHIHNMWNYLPNFMQTPLDNECMS